MTLSIHVQVPSGLVQGTSAEETLVPCLLCRTLFQDLRALDKAGRI